MRLMKPGSLSISRFRDFFSIRVYGRRIVLQRIFFFGTLIFVAVLATLTVRDITRPKLSDIKNEQPADATIRLLKDSKNIEDIRSVASAYSEKEEYSEAIKRAKEVAEKTQDTLDYISLLRLCTADNVTNKQACIDEVVAKLRTRLSSLPFFEAYIVGSMLDGVNQKKAAVDFYQRAYDIYDPNKADEYMKTKEQLKTRIDELHR